MRIIAAKSILVAVLSAIASVLLTATIVPAVGGTLDQNAWLMSTLCPLLIAGPCSAFTFWQNEKLATAHRQLKEVHAELATTHRRLLEKSRRDDMTGMLNRESFFAALEAGRGATMRGALLIIDADHFKSINDSHGHLTGDSALLEIAAAIRRGVRAGDVLGRIGGEEFAAILPGAADTEAVGVAERIRREVEQIRFVCGDLTVPLTVSIGGTGCRSDASVSDLMRAADRRLYEAKRRGRNRAIIEPYSAAA
ncbi:MAG: GGDEF domain-containing protein [Mesorhizobium sp.]|jgi:diguanylate cyclase (GGDEF)-like protein